MADTANVLIDKQLKLDAQAAIHEHNRLTHNGMTLLGFVNAAVAAHLPTLLVENEKLRQVAESEHGETLSAPKT